MVIVLLVLVVLSCTSGAAFERPSVAPGAMLELASSERAAEQRASLGYLFYRNNDLPPPPSAREFRALERDLEAAPSVEVEELRHLFGNDLELLAYATRDSDGDGVLDYRISEYRGKFFEGDIDLDGDGVRNVYDSAPYDPEEGGQDSDGDGIPDVAGSFADRDGDGIPDHLDWSRRKAAPLPDIQAGLFKDFGVVLVERSARFTPELAQATDDVLRLVFREPIATLRTVAVEDQLLISPDLGDNGFMLGQTQTLTVYTSTLRGADPLALLGLLVHEVDHAWQLAQDFDSDDLLAENRRMHFPPGVFTTSLERYGWRVEAGTTGEGYAHALYWPHFYATSPRYLFRDSSPAEWAEWFDELQARDSEFLRSSSVVSRGMVGPYAMTSPWEWHADHLMASVYNRLDQRLAEHAHGPMARSTSLLRSQMLGSVQDQWSRFDYRNAAGTPVDRELAGQFPLGPDELDLLLGRYVVPLANFPMVSDSLVDQVGELDVDEAIAAWRGVEGQARAIYGAEAASVVAELMREGAERSAAAAELDDLARGANADAAADPDTEGEGSADPSSTRDPAAEPPVDAVDEAGGPIDTADPEPPAGSGTVDVEPQTGPNGGPTPEPDVDPSGAPVVPAAEGTEPPTDPAPAPETGTVDETGAPISGARSELADAFIEGLQRTFPALPTTPIQPGPDGPRPPVEDESDTATADPDEPAPR